MIWFEGKTEIPTNTILENKYRKIIKIIINLQLLINLGSNQSLSIRNQETIVQLWTKKK